MTVSVERLMNTVVAQHNTHLRLLAAWSCSPPDELDTHQGGLIHVVLGNGSAHLSYCELELPLS